MTRISFRSFTISAAALAAGLYACTGPDAVSPPEDPVALHGPLAHARGSATAAEAAGLLRALHAATSRFQSVEQAVRAGYEPTPCVAVPGLGGMGIHYVNEGLVDPVYDPLQPEVILYVPDEHGKLRLVAVEYIVIDVGQPAPTFGTQPFDVGGTPVPVDHWSLHVWLYHDNPDGMFEAWNPDISC